MKLCPYCTGNNQDDDVFCRYCGRRQPSKFPDEHNAKEKKTGHDSCSWFLAFIPVIGAILFIVYYYLNHNQALGQVPSREETAKYEVTQTHLPTVSPTRYPNTPTTYYRPISWKELVSFISDDHTNWNEYISDEYVCLDFAIDLVESAIKQNIKAWIVAVDFTDGTPSHAFTGFETTDRGVVFIEPQADVPYIDPKVGQYLCDAWTGTVCMGIISTIEYMQCESNHSHYCDPYAP